MSPPATMKNSNAGMIRAEAMLERAGQLKTPNAATNALGKALRGAT